MSVKKKKGTVKPPVDAYDLFGLMSTLLSQPDKPDLSMANLWVAALDKGASILNLELCGMGNYATVVHEPADILSIPLQKKAFGIVLIHNCPTGDLTPSEEDIDVTDRLHQAAAIVGIKLLDHLIITENSFYDFKDHGLMDQIYKSCKYIPSHEMEKRLKKEISDMAKNMASAEQSGKNIGKIEGKLEIAKAMLKEGYDLEKVSKTTGLSPDQINRLV
ncbi:MAG: hypothetical protein NMK33_03250 [Candidatus Cardinium sp.]|uniref:JAB domain-containing protein n=1 Tax=Cardinium endosymbiont of Dermatophagoides farinae TaxID=2597823 RepID=UPI00118394C3|nr:JAB domain-containing protein [Cardinium endosymbiont of Dermatophagoides farinae]TSJ80495.1 hypothetical protein FPG78_00045 [Cardinium endosymbiont of Dermatophagoides farinae]UWW96459.1 MAG: hypothetical protein NMK33_03250 [Candidatus Cardinium sp.]